MGQLAGREDIFVDEFTTAVGGLAIFNIRAGDAVVHYQAIIGEQRIDMRKVHRQILQADMFEHADAGDPVERAGDVAIILQPDFNPVAQAGFFDALLGQRVLIFGKRVAAESEVSAAALCHRRSEPDAFRS